MARERDLNAAPASLPRSSSNSGLQSDLLKATLVTAGLFVYGRVMPESYLQKIRRKIGHELLLVPSVAAVIHDGQGRLLLQKKSGGEGWSLPAGAIEPGETPEAAVWREVKEETGLGVENTNLLCVFGGQEFRHRYPNGDMVEYTVALFRCDVSGHLGSASELDREAEDLCYFTREAFPGLALPYPLDVLF